jgi:RNA polymerase sigma-70 factor (ECF subfamily)
VDATSPPAPPRLSLTDSLEQLFKRHDRWFRPLVRRRHGDDGAEDLVHEVYLRAAPLAAAGLIRHPEALLVRIAANLASNRRRDGFHEVAQDVGERALENQSISPCQEEAVTFKQIVLALPDELRDVFLQNHVEGKTYEEIAEDLGLPRTTVHHRMRMALKRTSKALRD